MQDLLNTHEIQTLIDQANSYHHHPPPPSPPPPALTSSSPFSSVSSLPFEFLEWLLHHQISPSLYLDNKNQFRYIRLHPLCPCSVDELEQELKTKVRGCRLLIVLHPTPLPSFYRVSSPVQLSQSISYNKAHLYGIDLASGIAVEALELRSLTASPISSPSSANSFSFPPFHILDLCAAPGTKLAYISDILQTLPFFPSYTLSGVDLSYHRLASARTILKKYKHKNIRLYCGDACKFERKPEPRPYGSDAYICPVEISSQEQEYNVLHQSEGNGDSLWLTKKAKRRLKAQELKMAKRKVQTGELNGNWINDEKKEKEQGDKRKKKESSIIPIEFHTSSSYSSSLSSSSASSSSSPPPSVYHRILIDAECTHDGSIVHILKYEKSGWAKFQSQFLNPTRLSCLKFLQQQLISRGFELLLEGGIMVYSTCSFLREQNEDIVEYLLKKYPTAELLPIKEGEEQETSISPKEEADGRVIFASADGLRWKSGYQFQEPTFLGLEKRCMRLNQFISQTSGLFIAKIRKRRIHIE